MLKTIYKSVFFTVTVQPSASCYGHQAMQESLRDVKAMYHGLMLLNYYVFLRGLYKP